MTRKALITLAASAMFVSNCGGTTEPPQQQPSAQQTPAPEAAPPVDIPLPPAVETPSTSAPTTQTATADKPAPVAPAAPKAPPARPAYTRTDLQVGTGREAQKGKGLSVHYTGWLYDPTQPDLKGRMFDASKERGPFNFTLGAGQVIPGWDQGFDFDGPPGDPVDKVDVGGDAYEDERLAWRGLFLLSARGQGEEENQESKKTNKHFLAKICKTIPKFHTTPPIFASAFEGAKFPG